jgi:hypothetical protein
MFNPVDNHGLLAGVVASGYKAAEVTDHVASISPLAASNAEADELQATLVERWQRAAPHHLAWVDTVPSTHTLVQQGEQLTLVRVHNSMFAPTQVRAGG